MKTKPNDHSQENPAYIKQAADEVGLPERVKLPSPVQLAQIAAGFGAEVNPVVAVRKAVSLYLRAISFKTKHDLSPLMDMAEVCGDHELDSQLAQAYLCAPFKPTLLLKPSERSDEVRRKLAKCGLKLSKAKSVLENLRDNYFLAHMRKSLHEINIPITSEKGKNLCLFGKQDRSTAECDIVTRKEFDKRTEAIAKRNGWQETNAKRDWGLFLANAAEYPKRGGTWYRLSETVLGDLIEWKRSLKHTGGMKSRKSKKSAKFS